MTDNIWKLDGKKVDFREIINKAKDYGYGDGQSIFRTSKACEYLEKNGHKVECIEE